VATCFGNFTDFIKMKKNKKEEFKTCARCPYPKDCKKEGKCKLSKPKKKPAKPGSLKFYNR